ncbi:tetratricopeptide repeat protein [Cryptosporangium minutisporangium]|uniref:tetratricopeptide repeat protein n=1 Tax=Cryptosporangium minutisporangium TaxID=113569 RepID=UPI0031F12979
MVTALARAAIAVEAPNVTGQVADAEADANAFLDWASTTEHSWLVVLDDLADPDMVLDWWPVSHVGTGWVLATTRSRDALLSGQGRKIIPVDVYEIHESLNYLSQRLADAGQSNLIDDKVAELVAELGYLPLALSHMAAYLIAQRTTTSRYLELFLAEAHTLDQLMTGDPDGHGRSPRGQRRSISTALLLSLEAADSHDPVGLARPAMALVSVLDPNGHPEQLWTTRAFCSYLGAHRSSDKAVAEHHDGSRPVTPYDARRALLILDRFGLATVNEKAAPESVRVHALTTRAAWESGQAVALDVIGAAADSLVELWPEQTHINGDLVAVLRANTGIVNRRSSQSGDLLWLSGHMPPVLQKAGRSLLDAGLYNIAVQQWATLATTASRLLGADHPDSLDAGINLAISYRRAGHTSEAVLLGERIATDRDRIFGSDDPRTLSARAELAVSYRHAGRASDSITLEEQLAFDRERILGPDDPATLRTQINLAVSYRRVGRTADAVVLGERIVENLTRGLGRRHHRVRTALGELAVSYRQADRNAEAITIREEILSERERELGVEASETLRARSNLAVSYRDAERFGEAISLGTAVVSSRERILGADHPDTLRARVNLASTYREAGYTSNAIDLGERVARDRERVLGLRHNDTRRALANLALSYADVGRLTEASRLLDDVFPALSRLLGPDHPDVRTWSVCMERLRGAMRSVGNSES